MRCTVSLIAILGTSSWLALGCGGTVTRTATDGVTTDSAAALDGANGGIDPASKEPPAFDDPAIERLPIMDSALADATDMAADDAKLPAARSYRVALVWGHLPQGHDADDADPDPVAEDWNGSVSVDRGAIGLARTIEFDQKDSITPRTDKTTVAFTSHTLPWIDGVLLHVVVPALASTTLHFKTAALTTDIDLSQLPTKMGGVQHLATAAEEGLAWVGFEDDASCAKGFVHGRWVKDRAAFGRLRGVVSDASGERIGHVRGLWGHAKKRDADVFFGKYIDRDGDSRGLIAGKYADGKFLGLWATKDETDVDVGHIEGFYGAARDDQDGRGVWLGRWSEKCGK